MSRFIFIHDFFQDGRLDVLAEIRVLQVYGDWTKERRACWIKQAKSHYERSKHTHPHIPQGSSYYAGRIAGLKSAITAHYPTFDPKASMLFLPLPGKKKVLCLECGDESTWKCYPNGSFHLSFSLCDRCKQERVRTEASITTFGWNHDRHELLPLPVPRGDKLVAKKQFEPVSIFLPCTTVVGLGLLDMTLHIPILLYILQALLVLHFIVWGKDLLYKFCKWLMSEL